MIDQNSLSNWILVIYALLSLVFPANLRDFNENTQICRNWSYSYRSVLKQRLSCKSTGIPQICRSISTWWLMTIPSTTSFKGCLTKFTAQYVRYLVFSMILERSLLFRKSVSCCHLCIFPKSSFSLTAMHLRFESDTRECTTGSTEDNVKRGTGVRDGGTVPKWNSKISVVFRSNW